MNLNRIILPSKKIKYIKLCLISPTYEIIVNCVYIISFLILSYILIDNSDKFYSYQLNHIISTTFNETEFKEIESKDDFIEYLDYFVYDLFQFNPLQKQNSVPIFIPAGKVRLKKFKNDPQKCSEVIQRVADKVCDNYDCTIKTLTSIYEEKGSKCGFRYMSNSKSVDKIDETSFSVFAKKFVGKYSTYNLYTDGLNLDFTIEDYIKDPNKFADFINDNDLKFIALMFNLYFPISNNYATVIAGLEIINNFSFPFPIFNSSIIKKITFDDYFFLIIYIFFIITVALNLIKLIYEINVKFILSVHLFTIGNEIMNLLLIFFISFYISSISNANWFKMNEGDYKNPIFYDYNSVLSLRFYTYLIISAIYFCIPFRFISLISWIPKLVDPFIQYLCVIFRIIPCIIIFLILISLIYSGISLTNFFLYNGEMIEFENFYQAILMLFNIDMIKNLTNKIYFFYSMSDSKFFILINCYYKIVSISFLFILISTVAYLLKESIKFEGVGEENEVMIKLREIEEKLIKEELSSDNNFKNFKKQILWLNLGNKTELFNSFFNDYNRILLFSKAFQIISFLKYLFAVKPYMQFKNLNNKFGIIIQSKISQNKIKEEELENIEILLDWLNFVGCKIPVILFTNERIERNLRMKIATYYLLLKFSNEKEDLKMFINQKDNEEIENNENIPDDFGNFFSKQISFTLYKSVIVLDNKNVDNNNNNNNNNNKLITQSEENSSDGDDD